MAYTDLPIGSTISGGVLTIPVGDVNIPAGNLRLRVKAMGGNNAGNVLSNTTAFTAAPTEDPDALAYFAAVEANGDTLDTTFKTEWKSLVADFKTNGWYSSLTAVYPLQGSGNASRKINAISPGTRDLTFYGTWTHTTLGSVSDGIGSSRADTNVAPTNLLQDSASMFYYCNYRSSNGYDMACTAGMNIGYADGDGYTCCNSAENSTTTVANPVGFNMISRIVSTEYKFINNSTVYTKTVASQAPSASKIFLGNTTQLASATNTRFAIAAIGLGFTETESLAIKTRIISFLTAIGRNI